MKDYHSPTKMLTLLAACLLFMSAAGVFAQDDPGRFRGRGFFADMTEDQRAAFRELNQATRELNEKLRDARVALNEAIYAEKVDEAQIKAKVAEVAKVEEELAIARAAAFAKVRDKFTAEQIEALKNMGGRGFGGRGFGGGRRGPGGNN